MSSNPKYYGSIPTIATAYANDPRTKLSQAAIANGTSTAPVAQGGWGVTDGLARAAQAIVGALVDKKQQKKYGEREAAYTDAMQQAAALAANPQPAATAAPGADPMAAAASALGGSPASTIRAIDPNVAYSAQPASQGVAGGSPVSGAPMGLSAAPAPVSGGVPAGGDVGSIPRGVPVMRRPTPAVMTPADYYGSGIRPIEGGTDPRTGAFRTSPKGAIGPGQIMPKTGPEAARLAGLEWDDKRFRTDAAYNDALGQAYYAKQLQTFGDPLKAAAAYNAGPGRVRRAIRASAKSGLDYTNHLPEETREYVQKFSQKISGSVSQGVDAGQTTVAPTAVAAPSMEAVPQGPAPTNAGAVARPGLPSEVQTNRIAMAQQLLQSGNPDMVALAQTYLDKGLDEQNNARLKSSDQQFQQGQTQYEGDISMRNTGVASDRTNAYEDRRSAQTRNAAREDRYSTQQFTAGENAADRNFRGSESHLDRTAGRSNLEYSEQQSNARTAATIEGRRLTAAEKRSQDRNVYYSTPTGLKMQEAANKTVNDNETTIAKLKQYMDLNDKVDTGGMSGMLPFRGAFDKDYATMESIGKETTLSALGGSLGTAISDGDRKFISEANINARNPQQANRNVAQAKINALRRASERALAFGDAQADGTSARAFGREWSRYVQENTVVALDKNGNVTDQYVPFDVWKNRANLRTVR